ncbi:hypothetical protein DMENIID0001_088590 [Sergentomyia squamirostris]
MQPSRASANLHGDCIVKREDDADEEIFIGYFAKSLAFAHTARCSNTVVMREWWRNDDVEPVLVRGWVRWCWVAITTPLCELARSLAP